MRHLLLLSACLLPWSALASTFQTFDVPGAIVVPGTTGTCGSAVASNGLVAGNIVQPTMIGVSKSVKQPASFLYAAGRFSYPNTGLPTAYLTFTGINGHRAITGDDFTGDINNPVSTHFVYQHGTVTIPAAGTLAISGLSGITDHGILLGQATIKTPIGGGFYTNRTVGFLRAVDGGVTMLDDGSQLIIPRGMDAKADRVVGYGFAQGIDGWLFTAGAFTPVAYPGASFTLPSGVDEAGNISGTYLVGDLSPGGTNVSHGFTLRHGIYKTLDVPVKGAISTLIQGMNEADQITGCYLDAKGYHGFLRTP